MYFHIKYLQHKLTSVILKWQNHEVNNDHNLLLLVIVNNVEMNTKLGSSNYQHNYIWIRNQDGKWSAIVYQNSIRYKTSAYDMRFIGYLLLASYFRPISTQWVM